jgi:lipopolysaccharide transport system ATP-binding protein
MSDPVVRVENLSKKYIIGHQRQERYSTLRDSIANSAKNLLKPLQAKKLHSSDSSSEEFWALQNKQGDRVGIIGGNGAGKSTLLKILSRITEPTAGKIAIQGRVASLLEVGTGFHPELTGRENVYLNGAILGMDRVEIERKFDEIVAFAEVEKFLDTAVKRYSSGMYVRLAFAVAAHLEPEILIVDEVLAVGDAKFQKKCLGKMEEAGKEGRTVLFVSHNMASMRAICSRALLMKQGKLLIDAEIEEAISNYLGDDNNSDAHIVWNEKDAPQSPEIRFIEAYVINDRGEVSHTIDCRKNFSIVVKYSVLKPIDGLRIGFFMQNVEGVPVCGSTNFCDEAEPIVGEGSYASECVFPGYILNAGFYSIQLGSDKSPYVDQLLLTDFCLNIIIEDIEGHGPKNQKLPGIVRPKLEWKSYVDNF